MAQRVEGSTGTRVPVSPPSEFTSHVLTDVVLRRHEQVRLYGHNEDTPDGTGPDVHWLPRAYSDPGATRLEALIREDYDRHVQSGQPLSWMHLLREEFAEAMCAGTVDELYNELVDVAAVAVSWCEKIRQR